ERLQSAHDVKLQLKWIAENASSSRLAAVSPAARRPWDGVAWLVAVLLFGLLLGGVATWWVRARETPSAMYFNSSLPFPAAYVALSPDARTLAMVAFSDPANKNVIWIHPVGGRGATVVPGTEGAFYPFWAPNGRSIGFFADSKLKTVDIASGTSAQVLADAPFGRGGTWNTDGVILFTPTQASSFIGETTVLSPSASIFAPTHSRANRESSAMQCNISPRPTWPSLAWSAKPWLRKPVHVRAPASRS